MESTGIKIALIGTLDTKGKEVEYLRQCIGEAGGEAVVIDVSCKQSGSEVLGDYTCEMVARMSGIDFRDVAAMPKANAAKHMAGGASRIILDLLDKRMINAAVAIGGGSGTALGCDVLRALPRGFPKIMISSVAASDMSWHVGTKDIVVVNSVVDMCMTRFLRQVFTGAAQAAVAMARVWHEGKLTERAQDDRPLITASMYGVTQPCVFAARELLEAEGYEVMIFSAGGMGAATMEEFAQEGWVNLVLDATTTSLVDDIVGGCRSSGPGRLIVAGSKGVPQVIAPGAVDMANFGPLDTVPKKYSDRLFYQHTATTTLMRTNADEMVQLANLMADRLNRARGPVSVLIPRRGFSKYDHENGPFAMTYNGSQADRVWYDPEANTAFISALDSGLDKNRVNFRVIDAHINDKQFAVELVRELLSFAPKKHL